MQKKSEQKKSYILEKAKAVFIRKGFSNVTMKDIVDEAGISRGGLYLYFNSVEEIFRKVIERHNEEKMSEARKEILAETPFEEILTDFLNRQKKRLLNMDNSLLIAMHEYRYYQKNNDNKDFFIQQIDHTKTLIMQLLLHGVRQGVIQKDNIEVMAINIMFLIEGISTMAAISAVKEEIIINQFDYVKKLIMGEVRI